MARGSGPASEPITVAEIKEIARASLDKQVWDYYATGADEERTLKRNEGIYNQILLLPQVLKDVAQVDASTKIFGKQYDIPVAIAPSAYQKLASHNGEIDMARASHTLGTNFILSSNATTSLEDVAQAVAPRDDYPSPWFQLYFLRSRKLTAGLIQRAEAAGYEALVLTVDTVVLGNRIHERKDPLSLPPGLSMANSQSWKAGSVSKARLLLQARTAAEARQVVTEHNDSLVDASLSWHEIIPWLRTQTKMKIILKGIMTPEDAERSVEAGVDAVIVSNHGGRQLDGVPSTLEVLPGVADRTRGRIPVIFDGGISNGTDVFKALALGANLCLIGRAALWGLAYSGQSGVESVLHILERELSRTMALMGMRNLSQITLSTLGRARNNSFGVSRL